MVKGGIHHVFAHLGVGSAAVDLESRFYRVHLVRHSCIEGLEREEDVEAILYLTRMIWHHGLSMSFYDMRRWVEQRRCYKQLVGYPPVSPYTYSTLVSPATAICSNHECLFSVGGLEVIMLFEDIFMRTAGNKKKPGGSQPHGAMADDHLRPDHPHPVGCAVQGRK
jgi:hypothetical protein